MGKSLFCGSETNLRPCNNDDLRTHLANERTFLSWCRTSISLVVFGFVVERFELLIRWGEGTLLKGSQDIYKLKELKAVSLFCFTLAAAIILISGWQFLYLRRKIMKNEVSISFFPEIMVIISMIIMIAVIIVLLI